VEKSFLAKDHMKSKSILQFNPDRPPEHARFAIDALRDSSNGVSRECALSKINIKMIKIKNPHNRAQEAAARIGIIDAIYSHRGEEVDV